MATVREPVKNVWRVYRTVHFTWVWRIRNPSLIPYFSSMNEDSYRAWDTWLKVVGMVGIAIGGSFTLGGNPMASSDRNEPH